MRRPVPARAAALIVCAAAAAATSPASSPAAEGPVAAVAQSCPGFTVHAYQNAYRFYAIRAKGTNCRTVLRVIRGYFHGPAHRTGSSANDPIRVYGWNIIIVDLTATGRRGRQSFEARYR